MGAESQIVSKQHEEVLQQLTGCEGLRALAVLYYDVLCRFSAAAEADIAGLLVAVIEARLALRGEPLQAGERCWRGGLEATNCEEYPGIRGEGSIRRVADATSFGPVPDSHDELARLRVDVHVGAEKGSVVQRQPIVDADVACDAGVAIVEFEDGDPATAMQKHGQAGQIRANQGLGDSAEGI